MDPSMMGGAPPMDPSMMGGAPPMDPAMMGMDPAMMGMDPSMMPPTDPMAGAAPPGGEQGGMPIMLSMEDLKAILAEATGKEAPVEGESTRVTNKDIGERLDQVEMMLAHIANFFNVPLPEGGIGVPTESVEAPPAAEEQAPESPFTEPAMAAAGPGGMPAPTDGLMPDAGLEMMPETMKTASLEQASRDAQNSLRAVIAGLDKYHR
jgi:hypothetical protein